ncbi:MAG: 3-dehydroquinate synthase [Lachnospiraceae bacterium]|nr:3-dehydroquinate synthase [Lachnospiraceae bacterium]
MKIIRVNMEQRGYDICIHSDLACLLHRIIKLLKHQRILIVTDQTVHQLYGECIKSYFYDEMIEVHQYIMPAGEKSKQLETVQNIYTLLLQKQFDKEDMILAFGGGVVGDTAGFAASTYQRGIGFIQLPTTLLSQVDSSVGGKVGVNCKMVKNAIGSIYQPEIVCINPQFLKTLDKRQLRNGLAEIVVHSIIASEGLFAYVEEYAENILKCDTEVMEYLIEENCRIKRDVVMQDEHDKGRRAILNFGHTIGHAVEACSDYTLLHGEAVSVGIMGAIELAVYLKMLALDEYKRIKSLLVTIGLPVKVKGISVDEIYLKMLNDKKRRMEEFRFVLPCTIGEVKIIEYSDKEVLLRILNRLVD